MDAEVATSAGWVRRVVVGRDPRWTLVRVGMWAALLVVLFKFVLLPIRVEGVSMLPTYKERGVNFVNCLAYLLHPPQRGDVVAIRFSGRHLMLMKRIIALPGETIEFHEGHVFINGQELAEPYLKVPCNWDHPPEKVGPDEYYVVGDNRSMDFEQHMQGRAERGRIVGKVVL